jgi:hypothetical protein
MEHIMQGPCVISYSKLKNYETCPKRHFEIDITKNVREPESEQLTWGNNVHKALAMRLGHMKRPLPPEMIDFEPWASRFDNGTGTMLIEQKLAVRRDFSPCTYFDNKVWFRGVADVLKLHGPVAMVADWKTGKVTEDSVQLALSAAIVFAHHPSINVVRTMFVWLKDPSWAPTVEIYKREDLPKIWNNLTPRIKNYEQAWNTDTFPAQPSYLCAEWCPVTKCPHNGR